MAIIDQAFGHVRFNINILWIKPQKGKRYIYIYIYILQWNFYLEYSGTSIQGTPSGPNQVSAE